MIETQDIITVRLGKASLRLIEKHARLAEMGGVSRVRPDRQDRVDSLKTDQLVGQIGQYAGSKWMTGSAEPYRLSRWVANQNPDRGDGGSDILGSNIDFKASLVRRSDRSLLQYNLPVRPHERHGGWIYVLVLVTDLQPQVSAVANLMGWVMDEDLPEQPNANGVFRGAYVVPAKNLKPLPKFSWSY